MTTTISPLLRGQGLPEFQAISPELVRQDIPVLLNELDQSFSALEQALESALAGPSRLSWTVVMQPLQAIGERLRWSWGVVSHLNGVCNSPELRDAHAAQQPDVVRLSNRLGQSQILHRALVALQNEPAEPLNPTQKRILKSELLSMQQRGVGLSGDQKAAFNSTSERLAALSTQFGNHVLDATQQWTLKLTQPS